MLCPDRQNIGNVLMLVWFGKLTSLYAYETWSNLQKNCTGVFCEELGQIINDFVNIIFSVCVFINILLLDKYTTYAYVFRLPYTICPNGSRLWCGVHSWGRTGGHSLSGVCREPKRHTVHSECFYTHIFSCPTLVTCKCYLLFLRRYFCLI